MVAIYQIASGLFISVQKPNHAALRCVSVPFAGPNTDRDGWRHVPVRGLRVWVQYLLDRRFEHKAAS